MSIICPTVTAENPHIFREQLERVQPLTRRIHFDLANNTLAPAQLIKPIQLYWDEAVIADIHIMYKEPTKEFETLVSLQPHMVIIHAEAEGNLLKMMKGLQALGIKAGIALLQDTEVKDAIDLIKIADQALIFSGNFGHFGGNADLDLTSKISEVKELNPNAEIAWDGGINADNASKLSSAGVDVLNVGGFIQKSQDPQAAYKALVEALK